MPVGAATGAATAAPTSDRTGSESSRKRIVILVKLPVDSDDEMCR